MRSLHCEVATVLSILEVPEADAGPLAEALKRLPLQVSRAELRAVILGVNPGLDAERIIGGVSNWVPARSKYEVWKEGK